MRLQRGRYQRAELHDDHGNGRRYSQRRPGDQRQRAALGRELPPAGRARGVARGAVRLRGNVLPRSSVGSDRVRGAGAVSVGENSRARGTARQPQAGGASRSRRSARVFPARLARGLQHQNISRRIFRRDRQCRRAGRPDAPVEAFFKYLGEASFDGAKIADHLRALTADTALAQRSPLDLAGETSAAIEMLVGNWREEHRELLAHAAGATENEVKAAFANCARRMRGEFLLSELARRGFTPSYGSRSMWCGSITCAATNASVRRAKAPSRSASPGTRRRARSTLPSVNTRPARRSSWMGWCI